MSLAADILARSRMDAGDLSPKKPTTEGSRDRAKSLKPYRAAYSPAEDKEILRRKAKGQTWFAIGIAIARSGESVRQRYMVLRGRNESGK